MPAPPRRPPPAATTSPPRSSTSAPPSPPLTSGRRPTRWWAGVPGLGLVSLLPVAPALAHHGCGEQGWKPRERRRWWGDVGAAAVAGDGRGAADHRGADRWPPPHRRESVIMPVHRFGATSDDYGCLGK